MQAVLHNLSPHPRDRWVRCAFPKHAVAALGLATQDSAILDCGGGREMVAVRGRDLGEHSTMYRIRASLAGDERVEGQLRPPRVPFPQFRAHPWVSDDVADLIPSVAVFKGSNGYSPAPGKLWLVDSSAAHQRWHVRRFIEPLGFVFDWWIEFASGDPVADCWGRLAWSDRNDRSQSTEVDGVVLDTGELYYDHFSLAKGMGPPIADGKRWKVAVSGPRWFADGSGLDFAGQMLCFVDDPSKLEPTTDAEVGQSWQSRSIRDLVAASGGPVVAAGTSDWEGHWLACRNVPEVAQRTDLLLEFVQDWQRFEDRMRRHGDFYDDRPLGVGRSPGATGGKEDFGACKGAYVVNLGEPRWLHAMAQSAYADVYRAGAALFERGEPLDPAAHPEWVTWSGYTHWHTGVSKDRLGKDPNLGSVYATEWAPYDDQHRSQNNLAALYALTDDPLAESIMEMGAIPDAAQIRNRVGAPRAVGRLLGAWSQFSILMPDSVGRRRIRERIADKLGAALDLSRLNDPGPVKVIGGGGPDPRKQVYWPEGYPEAGQLAPWWSVWEHGLAAVGVYNLAKAHGDDEARSVVETICTTVVEHALFQYEGEWYLPDDVLWLPEGAALDPSWYSPESKQMVVRPGIGGTQSWGFCAVLIAAEVLFGASQQRAREAVAFFTGGLHVLAGRRTEAEWWACVDKGAL